MSPSGSASDMRVDGIRPGSSMDGNGRLRLSTGQKQEFTPNKIDEGCSARPSATKRGNALRPRPLFIW